MRGRTVLVSGNLARSLISFRGHLLRELVAAGHHVHVTAPAFSAAEQSALENLGVTVHPLALNRKGLNPFRDIYYLFAMSALCKKISADVVLAYTIKPVIFGLLGARMAGVSNRFALITGRGYALADSGSAWRPLRMIVSSLYRIGLKGSSTVFFQNPDDRQAFDKMRLLSSAQRVAVVNGSGVDILYFSEQPLSTKPFVFLMAARLLVEKGVRDFVDACEIAKRAHPEAVFRLAGGADSGPDCITSSELAEWKRRGTVEFLGDLAEMRPEFANCTVFVLPSYNEGTPRSVLEALATGRPVITTDAPGCRETVIPGKNGYLVPVRSPEALASAMCRLIDNPEIIRPMALCSREIAASRYDVRLVSAAMILEMGLAG